MIQMPIRMRGRVIGVATLYSDGQITMNFDFSGQEALTEVYHLAQCGMLEGLKLEPGVVEAQPPAPNPLQGNHVDCFSSEASKPHADRYLTNTGNRHHQTG